MGIDSVSSQGVVKRIHDAGLLGKGAGHVVLQGRRGRRARTCAAAAQAILDDSNVLEGLF